MRYWFVWKSPPLITGSDIYDKIAALCKSDPDKIELENPSTAGYWEIKRDMQYNVREMSCAYGVLLLVTPSAQMRNVCVVFVFWDKGSLGPK